jgi:hypothetical protein
MRLIAAALLSIALATIAPAMAAGAPKEPPTDDRQAKRISASLNYVHGPTLVTAIIGRTGGPRHSLTVEIGWDVPDAALRQRMALMRVRLVDSTRAALSDYTLRLRGGAPDLDQISALLQRATDAVLGQAGARLLLANVVILQR